MQVSAHDCKDIDWALHYHATEQLPPPGAESSARSDKRRAVQVINGHLQAFICPRASISCDCISCTTIVPPAPLQADWAAALSCWEAMGTRTGGAEERQARQQLLSQAPGFTGREHILFADELAYIRDITSMVCCFMHIMPLAGSTPS